MPNIAPQPGRIEPKQSAGKIPGVSKSALDVAGGAVAGGMAGGELAIAGKLLNARANKINKKNMAKFGADIENNGQASLPKAKGRISGPEQGLFISFALFVDVLEFVLDCFAIGLIANRIIDIVVAIIFFLYAMYKGLSLTDNWKIYASIIGTIIGEFIPVLDVAPFFCLDAWYITHTLKKQMQVKQQEMNSEANEMVEEKERQNWMENYARQQQEEQSVV